MLDTLSLFRLFPLIVAVLLAACASAPTGPRDYGIPVEPGAFYYDVTGNSEFTLKESLSREKAIYVPTGRFEGYTRWRLRWRYKFDESPGKCSLTEFTTELIIQLFLPHWLKPADPDPDLEAKWSKYLLALTEHEAGHVTIAQEAEAAVNSAAWRVYTARNCDELDRGLRISINQVIQAYVASSQTYDVASQHGATQGVKFP